jgi:MFS superfamily sulfate permease-like transporter
LGASVILEVNIQYLCLEAEMRFLLVSLLSLFFAANSFANEYRQRGQEYRERAQENRVYGQEKAAEHRVEDGRAHGEETAMERWKKHFERQEQQVQADGQVTEQEAARLQRFRDIEEKRSQSRGGSRTAQ